MKISMGKKVWTIKLEDGKHTVDVDESSLSGKRTIRVDGNIVHQDRALDLGKNLPFKIGKHSCAVRTGMFVRNYDLVVDGRSVKTGQAGVKSIRMPFWAWAFIAVCVAIPVFALGGLIPTGIGIGGAIGCAIIARDSSKTVKTRVAICFSITVICWVLVISLALTIILWRG